MVDNPNDMLVGYSDGGNPVLVNITTTGSTSSNQDLSVGTNFAPFNGRIDEYALYGYALQEDTLRSHWRNPPGSQSDPNLEAVLLELLLDGRFGLSEEDAMRCVASLDEVLELGDTLGVNIPGSPRSWSPEDTEAYAFVCTALPTQEANS